MKLALAFALLIVPPACCLIPPPEPEPGPCDVPDGALPRCDPYPYPWLLDAGTDAE